jgi:hypothetical protein
MTSSFSATVYSRRPNTLSLASRFGLLLLGISLPISVHLVGEVFIGECILLLLVGAKVLARPDFVDRWPGYMKWLALTLGLSLLGYMISDYFAGTDTHNVLRGWARVFFTAVNILGLYMVVRASSARLIWVTLGFATSGMAVGVIELRRIAFLDVWKLQLGYTLTLSVVCVLILGKYSARYLAPIALVALGTLDIILDSRSMGAVCIVCGCLQLSRLANMRRWRLISHVGTIFILTAGISLIAYSYFAGSAEFSKRRAESNSGRYKGLEIALGEIAKSPFLGHGSWSSFDGAAVEVLEGSLRQAGVKHALNVDNVGAHSQILQVWFEGGLLALPFPVCIGILLIKGMQAFRTGAVADLQSALLLRLFLFGSSWNLLFSPLQGIHRIYLAFGIVAVAVALKAPVKRHESIVSSQSLPLFRSRYLASRGWPVPGTSNADRVPG